METYVVQGFYGESVKIEYAGSQLEEAKAVTPTGNIDRVELHIFKEGVLLEKYEHSRGVDRKLVFSLRDSLKAQLNKLRGKEEKAHEEYLAFNNQDVDGMVYSVLFKSKDDAWVEYAGTDNRRAFSCEISGPVEEAVVYVHRHGRRIEEYRKVPQIDDYSKDYSYSDNLRESLDSIKAEIETVNTKLEKFFGEERV